MKNEPASGALVDALVDLYRKRNLAAQPAASFGTTPGAGRSCVPGRRVPGKRLRAWHRAADVGSSLKDYARRLATTSGDNAATAKQWLAGKGVRPAVPR